MPLPNFEHYKRPALEVLADGRARHWSEVASLIADRLQLTDEQRAEMIRSGSRTVLADRVQWALTDLRQAKLVEAAGRGINRITNRGCDYLRRAPEIIDRDDLMEFAEFRDFMQRRRTPERADNSSTVESGQTNTQTPNEQLEDAYEQLREELASQLLDKVKSMSPAFFEKLVVDLMLKLGYGGSRLDAGETLGKTGDDGVDGVINEDLLGLDKIYLQAKRWSGSIGAPQLRDFVGSLIGKGAEKGVFITTSSFTNDARAYLRTINRHIALIDGVKLATLMIDHDLGVATERAYEVKRLDSDYFEEV